MKTIILLALLAACSSAASANVDTIIKIQVVNVAFKPKTVNAKVGDTIRWIWKAGKHTTTSTSVPTGATTWNKPIDSAHKRFTYILKVAGTYQYQCNFHFQFGMVGTLKVTKALTAGLSSFAVDDQSANPMLNWKTNSSKDISYFSIQKSTDGDNFTEIARVQPNASNQYRFTDNSNASSKYVYYQIQMVDATGNSELSEIRMFTQKKAINKLITSISPNPVSNHIMLQFNSDEEGMMTVKLYNQSGAFITQTQMEAYKGLNNGHFHLGDLTSGTYYIVCTLGRTTEKHTIIVK